VLADDSQYLFIGRTAALYKQKTFIRRDDQLRGSAIGTSWLDGREYPSFIRYGNERSRGSLSQNEFDANVKEDEYFH